MIGFLKKNWHVIHIENERVGEMPERSDGIFRSCIFSLLGDKVVGWGRRVEAPVV